MKNRLTRALLCLALLVTATAHAAPSNEVSPLPAPASAPAAVVAPLSSTPEKPEAPRERTVLLLGDSLLASSFGRDLEERLEKHPGIRCRRRAKSSTGLARPDFFDWMEVGREEVERHQPDIVVIILGGNDGQGLTDGEGKAVVQWGHKSWEETYRQRTADFIQTLSAPGRQIIWLELPTTGLRWFERKLSIIRRIQREVLATRPDTHHLETTPFFTDSRGQLIKRAKVEGFRKPMPLKMQDGIHFTLAGGRYFATKVYPEVLSLMGLGTEQKRSQAMPSTSSSRALAQSTGPLDARD